MRDIKFRLWSDYAKRYLESTPRVQFKNGTTLLSCDDDCVIEQFTGLLDKNGKEIYEGDIVHIVGKTRVTENIKDSQGLFYITVEEGNWGFDFNWEHIIGYACSTHIMGCTDNDNRMENVEIIGNIHDNKDLL